MTEIMTTSRFPEITDELLSAYIDNAVTTGERALIEQAASEDAAVAWRLATLRETVALLRTLPMLNAPRAFVLTPEMLGQSRAELVAGAGVVAPSERPTQRPPSRQPAPQPGWWELLTTGWREFWAGGSPVWRNALATSMAALLVLLMLPALLRDNTSNDFVAAPVISQESAVAPASAAAEDLAVETTLAAAAANATAKQVAVATAVVNDGEGVDNAEAIALAPMVENADQEQAPLARVAEVEAAAAEAAVTAAEVTVRTIPGARTTEDALSGIASDESEPAYAAAAAAPPAPEFVAPAAADSVAAPESAQLAAPSAGVTAAGAASALPQLLATTDASAASPETAAPTTAVMPTATAAPTAAAVPTTAIAEARVIATALRAGAAMPTPPASNRASAQILLWLQLAALAGVVAFGLLWWRSRGTRI